MPDLQMSPTTPAHNPARGPARNPGIDLLRGISIILVIFNHVGLRIRLTQGVARRIILPRLFLNDLTFNGSEAVFIFFVVSGFLIATNSLERWGSLGAINVRAFYVRRASRIVPMPGRARSSPLRPSPGARSRLRHQPAGPVAAQSHRFRVWPLPQLVCRATPATCPPTGMCSGRSPLRKCFISASPWSCLLLRKDWILAPGLALLALSQPMALAWIHWQPHLEGKSLSAWHGGVSPVSSAQSWLRALWS